MQAPRWRGPPAVGGSLGCRGSASGRSRTRGAGLKQPVLRRHDGGMSPADTSLWRSWRERRDAGAFAALVTPHLAFASAFAHRLGCRGADADDVVQRALVSLVTDARGKAESVGVRAWLGRSVLNEVRVAARSTRRRARAREAGRQGSGARARSARGARRGRGRAGAPRARRSPPRRTPVPPRHGVPRGRVRDGPERPRMPAARAPRAREAATRPGQGRAPARGVHRAAGARAVGGGGACRARGRAAQAAGGTATVGPVGGGLVMGTSGKVAVAVGVALLLAGGGWWVIGATSTRGRRSGAERFRAARDSRTPRPPPAALAAGGRASASRSGGCVRSRSEVPPLRTRAGSRSTRPSARGRAPLRAPSGWRTARRWRAHASP